MTFALGPLIFPTILAQASITPISLSPTNSIDDNTAINIAVLLQSLDDDGNPDNGINILLEAILSATELDFTVPPADFAANTDVINLVANSGSSTTVMVERDAAVAHLLMRNWRREWRYE